MSLFAIEGTVRHIVEPAGTAKISCSRPSSEIKEKGLFDSWITPGPVEPYGGSSLTQSVQELLRLTKWSNRKLASILGTTHPTIASILRGNVPDRVQGLIEKATQVLNVVRRIWLLSGRDRARFSSALKNDSKVVALLTDGMYPASYMAAAEALSPRKARGPLMTTSFRRDPSKDVVPLTDDDYGE